MIPTRQRVSNALQTPIYPYVSVRTISNMHFTIYTIYRSSLERKKKNKQSERERRKENTKERIEKEKKKVPWNMIFFFAGVLPR